MLFRILMLDLGLIDLLAVFASVVVALLLGITVHEFSHGMAARKLGDRTAERLGRLSLDPRAHLDPAGSLMLCLVGFGWGKPVPINPYALRWGPKTGSAVVAVAGPLSNIALAALFAMPVRLGWATGGYSEIFFHSVVVLNVILAVFNLLPVPPLDGSKIAMAVLPPDLGRGLASMERYGMVILLGIIFLSYYTPVDILGGVVAPAVEGIADMLTGV